MDFSKNIFQNSKTASTLWPLLVWDLKWDFPIWVLMNCFDMFSKRTFVVISFGTAWSFARIRFLWSRIEKKYNVIKIFLFDHWFLDQFFITFFCSTCKPTQSFGWVTNQQDWNETTNWCLKTFRNWKFLGYHFRKNGWLEMIRYDYVN